MRYAKWAILGEVLAIIYLVSQGRDDKRKARALPRSPLLSPGVVRRTASAGPQPTGTVGAATYREGGGLY